MSKTFKTLLVLSLVMNCVHTFAQERSITFHQPDEREKKIIHLIKSNDPDFFPNLYPECEDSNFSESHSEDCGLDIKWKVAWASLDDGPEAQFILVGEGLQYCGAGDCPLEIFRQTPSGWTKIMSDYNKAELIVQHHITHGFHDLKWSSEKYSYKFDGKEYLCSKCD